MHKKQRVANLFGAAAVAATGAMASAAAGVNESGLSAAAALVTLASEPGIGVTELSRRVGLSQPATVRMLDLLARRGLVNRTAGRDSRSVALRLTTEGDATARRILAERERVLLTLLEPLDDEALADLEAALSSVLEGLIHQGASVHLTCRLCDERACVAAATCPVGEVARRPVGEAARPGEGVARRPAEEAVRRPGEGVAQAVEGAERRGSDPC
jgi:DNA-binding MarR family transcriptional regulator